jgi:hypothetical protein
MKIGYHFNADYQPFEGYYGLPIETKIFQTILSDRTLNISSKIFIGDLLLINLSTDKEVKGNTETHYFNKEKFLAAVNSWLNPDNTVWRQFHPDKILEVLDKNIFVVCFESIDLKTAEYLHKELGAYPAYLGAMEVDDSSKVHWSLYSGSLIAFARIINKNLSLFHQGEDDKDFSFKTEFEKLGFGKVEFENLNWKYTIFDTYANFEEARRIAEWKRSSGALLAFIADDIVSRLSDIAPELGNKLWSALKTFETAETNEQYAQVTATCRRIFEYVTDCIFPPTDEKMDGHSLKAPQYKNRLFAYADISRKSDTNIDLIVASTATLFEQWEKINLLSNKGVHSEVYRSETRRCLLRTIMLLDDIVSLKASAFAIKPKLIFDDIFSE